MQEKAKLNAYLGELPSTRDAFRKSPSDPVDQRPEPCNVPWGVCVNHIFLVDFPVQRGEYQKHKICSTEQTGP